MSAELYSSKVDSTAALRFAKIITTQGLDVGLSRQAFEAEITKRAEATRAPGESPQQAFVKYATQTEAGQLLLKASLMAPSEPPKQAPQDFPTKPLSPGEAHDELDRLAASMARSKGLSHAQAFTRLWSDPARSELVARAKREAATQRRNVAAQRWPIRAATEEFSR